MIFAAQMQARRPGKKTIFKFRGRRLSDTDVKQYWSRKEKAPADFSPVPGTPDGMEYRTPTPTPGDTRGDTPMEIASPQHVQILDDISTETFRHGHRVSARTSPRIVEVDDEADENAPSAPDDAMSLDMDLDVFQDYQRLSHPSPSRVARIFVHAAAACHSLISNYQSSTLQPLDSPEAIKQYENTVNCSREYFQWWVGKVDRSEIDWNHSDATIFDFRDAGLDLVYGIRNGFSKDHIDFIYGDWVAMIPGVLHKQNPMSILTIIDIMRDVMRFHGSKALRKVEKVLGSVLDQASKSWGKDDPGTQLMRSICHPQPNYDIYCNFVCCALLPAKDVMGKLEFDESHERLRSNMMDTLVELVIFVSNRESEALGYAWEGYENALVEYRRTRTDYSLESLLFAQTRLTSAQLQCGNYKEADELVEDAFRAVAAFHDVNRGRRVTSDLAYQSGWLNAKKGQFTAALEAFNTSLQLRLNDYGVRHYLTTQAAAAVRIIQARVDEEARTAEMWSQRGGMSL